MESYKNSLGRATWKFLDVFFEGYPEFADEMTMINMKIFIGLLAKLYPCSECQPMFEKFVVENKPETCCKTSLMKWYEKLKKSVELQLNK